MSKNSENYRRSLYLSTAVLSNRQECVVEKVVNSFDGNVYVRRSYTENKTEIYRLLAELKSQYLPEIVEIFENDGQTEVIERYIEGETLSSLIANDKISKKLAKSIASQLLCALSDIQRVNVIHRDIKPENIMISDGKLTLIDFGIARIFKEEETRDTRHLGTEGYAAPEQYGFSQSDKRTDIFSAGKTILKVCEAAQLKGVVKRTAEHCAQFDPLRRFATAQDALKYLNFRQKILPCAIISIIILASVATTFVCQYKIAEVAKTAPTTNTVADKNKNINKENETTAETQENRQINPQTSDKAKEKQTEIPKAETQEIKETKSSVSSSVSKNKSIEIPKTTEQSQSAQEQSMIGEDPPEPPNWREHIEIIRGKGKILWLFYPGENAKTESTINFRGGTMKIKAQLKGKMIALQLGEQKFNIIFGKYVSNYQSDTTILEADLYFRDIDNDGAEELFVGVRKRHGFADSSTTLWFARYMDGKFVLCDTPLCFMGRSMKFNIQANNRITTVFWPYEYHIEGNKFITDH